jgi:hypothetical protein
MKSFIFTKDKIPTEVVTQKQILTTWTLARGIYISETKTRSFTSIASLSPPQTHDEELME